MHRSTFVSFALSLLAFLVLDYAIHSLCLWLGAGGLGSGAELASGFLSQMLLPFLPLVAAGLIAGYVGSPRGFSIAFVAVLTGSLVSLFWTRAGLSEDILHSPLNLASLLGWTLGTSFAAAVAGWAGQSRRITASRPESRP